MHHKVIRKKQDRFKRTIRFVAIFILLLSQSGVSQISAPQAQAAPFSCPNPWPLRRGLGMFNPNTASDELLGQIAEKFEVSLNGLENADVIHQTNPDFKFLVYNSLSDTYTPPHHTGDISEHQWYQDNAASYGIDPEDTYLHFREDTSATVQGVVKSIPGWQPDSPKPGATATSRAESRVPVYFSNLSRTAVNFGTQNIRDLHRAFHVHQLFDADIGDEHYDGFIFDNAAFYGLRISVLSGGEVAEHPTNAVLNTTEFTDWYWYQGIGLFMKELREWAATDPPELAGREMLVAPNISNVPWMASADWDEAYVDLHPADILVMEFQYDSSRNYPYSFPGTMFQKHTLAHQMGIELYETGLNVYSRPPYQGSWTLDQTLMNTLALHWVTRTPSNILQGATEWPVSDPDWTNLLRDGFNVDLGQPLGDPYVIQAGTDPKGYTYNVYAREFSCGLAVTRNYGSYNQDIDEATAIDVTLPDEFYPVDMDGNLSAAVSEWSLRNGQAQIFLATDVTEPPCLPDWQCSDWTSCVDGEQTRNCVDVNSCGVETGHPLGVQSCEVPDVPVDPCVPDWECGSWSSCSNGTQTRICTDLNACGDESEQPDESRSCTVPAPPDIISPGKITTLRTD